MREHILLDKLLAWFICIICDVVCLLVMGSAMLGTDPLPFTVKHNQLLPKLVIPLPFSFYFNSDPNPDCD